MTRSEAKVGIVGCIVFALAYPSAVASSLLIAPLMAFTALIMLPLWPHSWREVSWPWASIPLALFLVWVGISFLWSPHDDPQQIPKTVLGIPLYILFAVRVGMLEGRWRSRVEAMLIFTAFALGLFLFAETLTGGSGTASFKTTVEGVNYARHSDLMIDVNRSLGHAAAPLVLLAGPAVFLAWHKGGPLIGIVLGLLTLVAAFSFETQVNAAAYVIAAIAAGLALRFPRPMLAVTFGGIAGAIVTMPLIVPGILNSLPPAVVESIPLSWAWRLEIWAFASELIYQAPWFGHGLDASRPLSATIEVAGRELEGLPLHPHNSALQIWLETGLVGALLLGVTLVALGEQLSLNKFIGRIQCAAIVWVAVSYAVLLIFSYGVWQEWHQGAVALAASAVFFLRAKNSA